MKLKEFAKHINTAVKAAGDTDPDIEFTIDDGTDFGIELEVKSIGQFSFVPDVTVIFNNPEEENNED